MELSERKEPLGVMDRAGFALQEARGYALEAFPAVRMEGPVNADLMKQAFMETLELFPRLRHVVEVDRSGRRAKLYWREALGDLGHAFELHDLEIVEDTLEAADAAFNRVQHDLINSAGNDMTRDIGIKIYLYRANPKRHYALMRFNHIMTDGRGMILAMAFWGLRYLNLLEEPDAPPQDSPFTMPEDEQSVTIRSLLKDIGFRGMFRFVKEAIRNIWLALRMPAAHLTDYVYGLEGKFNTYDSYLAPEKAAAIRRRAKAMGMTINDLALAAGYHAVLRFCNDEGIEVKRIALNSPKDIRTKGSSSLDNLVVARQISLVPGRIRDDRHLIATIREELERLTDSKVYYLGRIGIFLLGMLPHDGAVRMLRRSMARGNNPTASLLISNVGEVMNYLSYQGVGDTRAEHVYHGIRGQYPPGYMTPLLSFKGTMILGMGYYEPAMTEEKCRRFGQYFFEEMERISRLDGE
ncbi:hypothetical protein ACFL4G_03430 [Thermodesulfobacteriota bacterium]